MAKKLDKHAQKKNRKRNEQNQDSMESKAHANRMRQKFARGFHLMMNDYYQNTGEVPARAYEIDLRPL